MNITDGKLEWFGGDQDALNMFRLFVDLSHIWDDLVDKDKPVSGERINHAFLCCLVYLQANPFYRSIQDQVLPMWITVISAYETANKFEAEKEEHGVEISHGLRYAAGHIVSYAVHVCVGEVKAREIMPEVWKCIYFERYDEYREEHLNVKE